MVDGLRLTDTWEITDFLKKMPTLPFDSKPGEVWAYSNSNYVLLGLIVQKITGKPVLDVTEAEIFKPLKMEHSRQVDYDDLITNRAAGYYLASTGLINAPHTHGGTGDGAELTTVDDLIIFERAFREGKLVSAAHVNFMRTRITLPSGHMPTYGYGWFVRNTNHQIQYSHAGASAGYGSDISYFPERDIQVAIMSYVYGGVGDDTARLVAEAYDPTLKVKRLNPTTDPDPARTAELLALAKQLAQSKIPETGLDPAFRANLGTPRGKMGMPAYKTFQSIDKLAFLESQPDGTDLILRYRAEVANKPYLVSFVVSKDGSLYGAGTRPEA